MTTETRIQNRGRIAIARRHIRGVIRAVRSENRVISRYIFNAGPVLEHRRQPPTLAPGPAGVAAELEHTGVAVSSVQELLGGGDLYAAVLDRANELRADPHLKSDPAKPFLTELFGSSPAVSPTDPLIRFALHPQVRGIAETYAGMRLRVQDVNVWVNQPVDGGATQSQRWHRDLPEDFDIVKCFIYLSDVPDGAGPLQYVAGTNTSAGRRVRLATTFDGIGHRFSDGDVATSFGDQKIVTARAGAGAVVFADTRGIHRGGFARDAERVVAQITYASQACSRPRNLRAAPGVDRRHLRDLRLVP